MPAGAAPTEHLLMSSLEELNTGHIWQPGERLSPHITVMPWFHDAIMPAVINGLQNLCSQTEPIKVMGGNEALFGPNGDVPVRTLTRASRLPRLHTEILELIRLTGGVVESKWVGPLYEPHVSYLGHVSLAEGETVELTKLELVDKYQDGSQQIKQVLRFSGHVR